MDELPALRQNGCRAYRVHCTIVSEHVLTDKENQNTASDAGFWHRTRKWVSTEMTYTKQQIVDKAREVADMIAETEEVDFFKRAEAQINENQQIREKIASLKSLQKQAVNFQHYGKERALDLIEKKIQKIEEEIDAVPIVQEFKQSQSDVNSLLQMVSTAIANQVTNNIITDTGGDLLRGETGSKVRNDGGGSCS